MKKYIIYLFIIESILTNTASCEWRQKLDREAQEQEEIRRENAKLHEDELIKFIITAINERDSSTIKDLFSPKALENSYKIDESINKLFDRFEDEIINYEGGDSSGGSFGPPNGTIMYDTGGYILSTENCAYLINYDNITYYNNMPEAIGLHSILVTNAEDLTDESVWDEEKWGKFKSGVFEWEEDHVGIHFWRNRKWE
jgi:hypothetical protein